MFLHRIRTIAIALTAALTAPAPAGADGLSAIPHQVLAFYYGWYTPQFGIGDWTKTMRWTAADGPYNSWDKATTDRQVSTAINAGITGFIASWWPERGAYTDRQLQTLLQSAQPQGFSVAAMIEDIAGSGTSRTQAQIVSDLEYVLASYGGNPAWLKIGGRPVLFLFVRVIAYLPNAAAWNQVLATVRADYPGAIILGDFSYGYGQDPRGSAAWDGLYAYNAVRTTQDRSVPDIEARQIKAARAVAPFVPAGDVFTLTVGPGYDDSETTRSPPRPIVERHGGGTYRALWRAAMPANPDWILISTWNEWVEGSQIEPSIQFGSSALDDTANFSSQFLAQAPRGN